MHQNVNIFPDPILHTNEIPDPILHTVQNTPKTILHAFCIMQNKTKK